MQVCRYVRMYACSIYVAYIYIYMHIYTHAYTHVYFVSITKLSSVSSCFQDLDNVPYLSAVINEGPSCASNDHQVWGLGLGFRASLGFSLIGSRIRGRWSSSMGDDCIFGCLEQGPAPGKSSQVVVFRV